MRRESWVRYLVAAALVLLVGAVWALAEETEMKVEVRNEGGQEITIDINGVSETVHVGDLAEGEERTFDVGDHSIVVKRVDDSLVLINDEHGMGGLHLVGEGHPKLIQVDADENCDHPCKRVVIMKKGDGETVDIEELTGGDGNVFFFSDDDDSGDHEMKWIAEGGEGGEGGPIIIKRIGHHGGDIVTYRCEETGSMLMVKADENLLDDYLDPVTGCVMKKIENAGAHVIEIREKIVTEDEDDE